MESRAVDGDEVNRLSQQERLGLEGLLGVLFFCFVPWSDIAFVLLGLGLFVFLSYRFGCAAPVLIRPRPKALARLGATTVESRKLKVFVGTWNVGDSRPPLDQDGGLDAWFHAGKGEARADIYAIGVQECDFKTSSKTSTCEEEWISALKKRLGDEVSLVAYTSAREAIRLCIFVSKELESQVSNIEVASTLTQVPFFFRKGANGIAFTVFDSSFCFVNCHLSAHQKQVARRRIDIELILHKLFRPPFASSPFVPASISLDARFDHVFFFGDLNFRIDRFDAEQIEALASAGNGKLAELQEQDQLIKERGSKRILADFAEHDLDFPPTYKYKRGTSADTKRVYAKGRKPAWCDRVLFKSVPALSLLSLESGSVDRITTSDHSPVYATFEAEALRFGAGEGGSSKAQSFVIRLESLRLSPLLSSLNTDPHTSWRVEYYPSFVDPWDDSTELPIRSEQSPSTKSTTDAAEVVSWQAHELPGMITPPVSASVLRRQHVVISIHQTSQHLASLFNAGLTGVALLPLSPLFDSDSTEEVPINIPKTFQVAVHLSSREVGTLSGTLKITHHTH